MKIFESKPTESTPPIGNTGAFEPTDKVRVIPHEVIYKDPENSTYDLSRNAFQVNGETIVFTGSSEKKEDVLQHMPEGCKAVSANAKEVVEFARRHNSDPYIASLYESITSENYTQETLDYFDAVIAAMCLDQDGEPLAELNTDALGDVLAGLLGDEEKQGEIALKVGQLRDYRTVYSQSVIKRQRDDHKKYLEKFPEYKNIPELAPENVVLVHVTKYEPQTDEQGNIIIYPNANYDITNEDGTTSDSQIARGTIHFTVNSRVENHMYGNHWEGDENYVIISNLGSLLEHGEVPVAANEVDTYFESSPGDPLVMPGAILLKPIKGESFEDHKIRVQNAMRQEGAKDIFVAGEHYLRGTSNGTHEKAEDFQKAFSAMCIKEGIRKEGVHMGTQDVLVESAFYGNSVLDSECIKPETFMRACAANQRWAACNGVLPTAKRVNKFSGSAFSFN